MILIVENDCAARDSLRLLLDCVGLEARGFPTSEAFLDGWRWLIPLSQARLYIGAALFPKPEFGRRTGLGRSHLGAFRSLSFCDVVHA